MKIQSVAILGAGAVGSYIIWGLSKKDNIRLGVIAEGDRARRLKESGCAIMEQFTARRSGPRRKRRA